VEAFGKNTSQRGFADAQGAFNDNVTRRLRTALGDARAFCGRGFVRRHFATGIIAVL